MSEESRSLKSVPTSETSSSEWDKSLGFLKAMFNGDKTYDNRTEEIQLSRRTTYRNWNHRVTGTVMLSNGDWRASVTRAAVRMGWKERDANKAQGRIQMGSKSGTGAEMWETTVE